MLCFPLVLCAQLNGESFVKLPLVVPPSPEATSLGKFGSIPVSLYTGTAEISIPLHQIKIKDFEMPLSLDYHTAGVKVEEVAGNVGLGWALKAGGQILWTVRGKHDFDEGGFCRVSGDAQKQMPSRAVSSIRYNYDESDGGNLYQFAKKVADGEVDSEPDLFSFSCPGNSGKFFFDQTGVAHTVPLSNHKIETTGYSFVITDDKGIRYQFDDTEVSYMDNSCSVAQANSFTLLLTKIVLPDKNEIAFFYDEIAFSYKIRLPETARRLVPGNSGGNILECINTANTVYCTQKRLARIESTVGHRISFFYSASSRKDLPGNNQLERIEIGYNSKIVQRYSLVHSYFGNTSSADDCRLKLDMVQEQSGSAYSFTYDRSSMVPNRLSSAQDHWGYYNGQQGNPGLLPAAPEYGFYSGANREVDVNYAKVGSLTKIVYPTGGQSVFDYESNTYHYTGEISNISSRQHSVYSISNSTSVRTFVVVSATSNTVASYKASNAPPLGEIPDDEPCSITLSGPGNYFREFHGSGTVGLGQLQPGTYTMSISTQGNFQGHLAISYQETELQNISRDKEIGGLRILRITDYEAEGRIARLRKYSYVGEDSQFSSGKINFMPRYIYRYSHAFEQLQHDNIGQQVGVNFHYADYWKLVSSSVYPISSVNGGSVGYSFVCELAGENGEFGKTTFKYSQGGETGGSETVPIVSTTSYEWRGGLLEEKKQYRYISPGSYVLLQSINNYYSTRPDSEFWSAFYPTLQAPLDDYVKGWGLSIIYKHSEYTFGLARTPAEFYINDYHTLSKWHRLDSIVAVHYDGPNPIRARTWYCYDNPAHLLANRIIFNNSKKEEISQLRIYPQDAIESLSTNAEAARSALVAKYAIATILEEKEFVNSHFLKKLRTNYKIWPENGLVLPENVKKQIKNSALENVVEIHGYDGFGRVLSQSQNRGPLLSYKYSGSIEYPVAEVKNASEAEFFYESFEEKDIGVNGPAHTGDKYFLGSYTVNWPVPNVRQYVMSYWYYQGGVWKYSGVHSYTGPVTLTEGDGYDDICIYPKDAVMRTWTYEPLVGISSSTDEKGNTIYYKYDSFQRLQYITDHNGAIVKEYTYHYKQ